MLDIQNVGVVGCGAMGSGIIQLAAQAGYSVHFIEAAENRVGAGRERIRNFMQEGLRRGKIGQDTIDVTLSRITGSTAMGDLAACQLVIEAVYEDIDLKKDVFRQLDEVVNSGVILATNTSGLCVTEMAGVVSHPERLVGLHFFNPPQLMKLVEIIRTLHNDEQVLTTAVSFVQGIGKEGVVVKDTPGFVVNRLLIPYLNQAIEYYDSNLASREDLDLALELGLGYPMGPLKLLDLIGLDVHLHASEALYSEFYNSKYVPPTLLRRMVQAGFLGRKTGRGFYNYPAVEGKESK